MEYVIVSFVALVAAGLTLFSGFGLGTLLLPAFALFFPASVAVGLTAVVHLLNNLFKLALLGKHASLKIVLRFGLPAIVAAFAGAYVLLWFADLQPLTNYSLAGRQFEVTPVGVLLAVLIAAFALLELVPQSEHLTFEQKYLPVGGLLSGFFGGLSGHQGALRSAFLLKCGLSKESFIATGVVIACFVDVSRLFIYRSTFSETLLSDNRALLIAAVAFAFCGAFLGSRLLGKVTMYQIRVLVAVMLFGIALGLGSGMI